MPERPLTGQELDGYVIGPLIGYGGMGRVYQAYPPNSTTPVALKILNRHYTQNSVTTKRFLREIRVMEVLRHENIIPILSAGIVDDQLYFTMKLINGFTLATLMTKQRFSPLDTWQILEQVAQGLHYMHQQNVIHRDIKPGNIFLERKKEYWHVYIGDFSLSKKLAFSEELTPKGLKIGTFTYMPPEAALGRELDHCSDIYSLTMILYEMLLATNPLYFLYEKGKLNFSKLISTTTPPTSLNPHFPPNLEKVLLRGLEKKRQNRYQSVLELAKDYQKALLKLTEKEQNTDYSLKK